MTDGVGTRISEWLLPATTRRDWSSLDAFGQPPRIDFVRCEENEPIF